MGGREAAHFSLAARKPAATTNFTIVTFFAAEGRIRLQVVYQRCGVEVMRAFTRRLCGDQRAATVIEYSLIVFLIGTAAIGALTRVGQSVLNVLGAAANAMT